jgi:hypothetical protein
MSCRLRAERRQRMPAVAGSCGCKRWLRNVELRMCAGAVRERYGPSAQSRQSSAKRTPALAVCAQDAGKLALSVALHTPSDRYAPATDGLADGEARVVSGMVRRAADGCAAAPSARCGYKRCLRNVELRMCGWSGVRARHPSAECRWSSSVERTACADGCAQSVGGLQLAAAELQPVSVALHKRSDGYALAQLPQFAEGRSSVFRHLG